ncbi:MAG: glycosyltransferase family 4 protein [Actinomycetota bacterium]|nr:glycosyltransferase family 4 protein [Actinomycetota bacterium]
MRDRTRVLVVTTALVPDQLCTWQSASELDSIDLHIAGSLEPDVSESYLAPLARPTWGVVHELAATGLVRRGRLWWRLAGLETLIHRLRPDVVHVHSEVWGLLVSQALRAGSPVVAHGAENESLIHGGWAEGRARQAVARRNSAKLAGYASWNRAGIDLMRRNGLALAAPTAVAPAIVPDPAPYLAAHPVMRPASGLRVGYVGRLVPEKGVQWLIAALAGIEDATLVVIGSGPHEAKLQRQARRQGVAAEWHGEVSAEEMPAAYALLDILVVPSVARPGWSEQFGRVVCEAMLSGVPVVASDSGALLEVVGDAGAMVRELDHQGLHATLRRLAEDPAERRLLGVRGRAWAQSDLAPDAAAGRLGALWRSVALAS